MLDLLDEAGKALSISEITKKLDEYLSVFSEPRVFDESTVRKKLREYVREGMLVTEKREKSLYYKRTKTAPEYDIDLLHFFSEIAPCGIIGSYLLDKKRTMKNILYSNIIT